MIALIDFTGETRAQAMVEMVVVVPVLLVLALITYNIMLFLSAVARFDRVAPDIVLAHAAAPAGVSETSAADKVASELERAMGFYDVDVDVTCVEDGQTGAEALFALVGGQRTYRCALAFTPWPSGFTIAGVSLGAPLKLEHVREVVVDPWRPGVVM